VSTFKRTLTVTEARFEAQRIAFAPVIFQVVQVMRRTGGKAKPQVVQDHLRKAHDS
jgi:Asp-tRNA(Asn)/Glu-tRNA(Gln) amidotransferase B subunit